MTLSILVCTMPSRAAMWGRLQTEFWQQALPFAGEIELLSDDRMDISIGAKRNALVERANGKYLAFHDDDDWPEPHYIKRLMDAAATGCDCASLKGIITWDGIKPEIFEHSLKYSEWRTNDDAEEVKYIRTINHLNMVRSEVAKNIPYPDLSHGEDSEWSRRLAESEALKDEYYISEVIYNYRYVQNK